MELNSVLKPLRVVSKVIGLNVEGRLGRAYTILVFAIVTLLLYASFIRLSSDKTEVLTNVDDLILWTQFGTHAIFVTVVLGCCLVRPRHFLFPVEDMHRVDFVFRYKFSTFFVNDYQNSDGKMFVPILQVIRDENQRQISTKDAIISDIFASVDTELSQGEDYIRNRVGRVDSFVFTLASLQLRYDTVDDHGFSFRQLSHID